MSSLNAKMSRAKDHTHHSCFCMYGKLYHEGSVGVSCHDVAQAVLAKVTTLL